MVKIILEFYNKDKIEKETGGLVSGMPQYDSKLQNGERIYDTSRNWLHIEKTAKVHKDEQGNTDGRTFDLTLEGWNIGNNIANVGSMVWPSDSPEKIKKNASEWHSLIGNYNNYSYLSQTQVDKILNKKNTDNSRLNYNGYKYYLCGLPCVELYSPVVKGARQRRDGPYPGHLGQPVRNGKKPGVQLYAPDAPSGVRGADFRRLPDAPE